MPSTYTARNRAEKQAPGENSNAWGALLNAGTIDIFDQALDGMLSFTLSAPRTLAAANGTSDEARCRYLNISGGSGGTVTIPNVEKVYVVRNGASGTATFTTGSGTSCTLPAGTSGLVVCEGGNVCRSFVIQPYGATLSTLAGATAAGLALMDDADAAAQRSTLGLGAMALLSAVNGAHWSGQDLALADGGTGASTATAARSNLGLGSLATASTINDANWSGTDLAIGNGGTGASSAATALSNLGGQPALSFSSTAEGSCISAAIGATTYRLQWGRKSVTGDSVTPITFPVPFTAAPTVVVDGGDSDISDANHVRLYDVSVTTTGFSATNNDGGTRTAHWIALGS